MPIEHQAIDNGAAVALCANCVKNQASISGQGLKSTLDNLKRMGALKNRHAWLNLWVHRCQQATRLNCDKNVRNKWHLVNKKGLGGRHID